MSETATDLNELFPAGPFRRPLSPPVVRPNGKVYQPVKLPVARGVEDHHGDLHIYVLRTHQVERAYQLATSMGLGDVDRESAECTWIRDTYWNGERVYDTDPVRGCAAVTFEVS